MTAIAEFEDFSDSKYASILIRYVQVTSDTRAVFSDIYQLLLGLNVSQPSENNVLTFGRPGGVETHRGNVHSIIIGTRHLGPFRIATACIADVLGDIGCRFHLMGTSIGATMAWWLAAKHQERVVTLVCINIPHPAALAAGRSKAGKSAEGQNAKFNYIAESAREGNERNMFEAMLATQGVSAEESEPYRKALDSDEALRAVYYYYRAIPLWMRERLDPVAMPTLFIWPTGSENVASASIEANANCVTGPYRLEIVADVHQPVLQAAPEHMTPLLLEHLAEHAR